MTDDRGSIIAGWAICWLLNIAQLGVGWLLLIADVRMLSAHYVLVYSAGLVQVGYVVPFWRLLLRTAQFRTARGLLMAACTALALNVVFIAVLLRSGGQIFRRVVLRVS